MNENPGKWRKKVAESFVFCSRTEKKQRERAGLMKTGWRRLAGGGREGICCSTPLNVEHKLSSPRAVGSGRKIGKFLHANEVHVVVDMV